MHPIDWFLVSLALSLVVGIGVWTQRYMKSVADFMSAGRVARRYLLAVSRGEGGSGAVVFVAAFEVFSHSGFTNIWWGWLGAPVGLFVAITGFVIYRYRETRAMTLGQFFEIRYSKRFRLFTGILGFCAGLVNFGIIPAVGSRFLVYFLGVPAELHIGGMTVPTYIPLMAVILFINLFVTLTGGLITIMMTNCAEGIITQVLYLVLIVGLLKMFGWSQISAVMSNQPHGQSLMNPMDSLGLKDFNLSYVLMSIVVSVYGTMAWQNQSAYNSAPLTAHEGVMGGLLGKWRDMGRVAMVTLLAVCALTYLRHPDFAVGAAQVQAEVGKLSNPQIREQMEVPIAVTHLLPVGLKGALCAILLLGISGGDSAHLHSWGSLFIQDVVLPLRRKELTPQQHIRMLRLSIIGVAFFAFLFGSFFTQTEYIMMWWSVTTSLYVGGAGAAIIGGLYWNKGTTTGAWSGLLTGFLLSGGGILARQIYGGGFPLNGTQISFYAMIIAVLVYVGVSLATCRRVFDMDRMLHRGLYAAADEQAIAAVVATGRSKITWARIIGYDEHFTRGDRWIAITLFAWTLAFCLIMVCGTLWNLVRPWPLWVWSDFWYVNAMAVPILIAVVTGVWFTWGGILDTFSLFRLLRQEAANPLDNGAVRNHQNLDENAGLPVSPLAEHPAGVDL